MATLNGSLIGIVTETPYAGTKGRFYTITGFLTSSAGEVHYKLRAFRTSDSTMQYWTDAVVSLASAPGGAGNYNAASLTIEGSWSTLF